jgi:hypothetical protein
MVTTLVPSAAAQPGEDGSAGAELDTLPDELLEDDSDEGETDPLDERANIGLVAGLKLGAGFSQPFSKLGSSVVTELELGYLLPLPDPVGRSFQLFLTLQYAQPSVEGEIEQTDPRLPDDGIMKYNITQQQLVLTPGVLYRLPVGGELLRPYAALGARVYMMRTLIEAEAAGESFGDNEETATSVGFYGALGCDIFLGPGAILAELQLAYASLDGYVMRETNVGALNLAVGYRLIL